MGVPLRFPILKKKHVDVLGWTIEKYWDRIFQDPTICVFCWVKNRTVRLYPSGNCLDVALALHRQA